MTLSLAAVVGMGRKTVSNMLVTAGLQASDWTASYRMFSKKRFDQEKIFDRIVHRVHALLPAAMPFVAPIDDTALHKCGKKVHGASYRRDAQGPKFHTNLIWAQRFLQLTVVLPSGTGAVSARTIPVDFQHAPLPPKPKKNASEEEQKTYARKRKDANLSLLAARRIRHLRDALDAAPGGRERTLWIQGDGSFTNANILRNLPERTLYTGRVRKDAKLHFPPPQNDTKSKRIYGPKAPTPEQVLQDPAIPWQEIEIHAAGKIHSMHVKTLAPVRSAIAGATSLRLIVIEPLGYRLRKNSKILYRQPAYLLCTDLSRELQETVQNYVWRWEIEVNHRDEKNLLGAGEAQVWTKTAAASVPAFLVASYAMALLAAYSVIQQEQPLAQALPRPKWQKKGDCKRPPFQHIIQAMRTELWAHALGAEHATGFVTQHQSGTNANQVSTAIASTVLCTSN
jgi:hypothetical protein